MLRLIRSCLEFQDRSEIKNLGKHRRGIYVLYQIEGIKVKRKVPIYEVVYIGMTDSDMAKRLRSHNRSKIKKWTHFSVYSVWPNITKDEILELEGLFRHIYRRSKNANAFNIQRGSNDLRKIRVKNLHEWKEALEK